MKLRQLVRKPFKGGCGYEWQIGPLVLIVFFPNSPLQPDRTKWEVMLWIDHFWLSW